MKFGYCVLGLVIFRILWGFFGTRHARFKNFVPSFYKVAIYIKQVRSGEAKHYIGHNPLGSLMVLFLLFAVLLQAITGLFIDDDIFSSGPYNGVLSEQLESLFKSIHSNGFNFILAAAFIHVAAVFYYLLVKKQNLIKPMIDGKKPAQFVDHQQAISHSKILRAVIIGLCVMMFIYWLVVLNVPVVEEYY